MSQQNSFTTDERERLRALLTEDANATDKVEDLLPVMASLKDWDAPQATRLMTARLIDTLAAEMPPAPEAGWRRLTAQWWPLLLIRAQFRVVHREIWAASALMLALGTLVTLLSYQPNAAGLTPLAIFAPLVAAVGVAFLYDGDMESMLEIENATPASARLLLLARLTLVFGFDLALGLVGSILLAAFHADVLLWPLVWSWLAPMAFLSASAFFLSILLGDALVGSLFGLMAWGLHVWMRVFPVGSPVMALLSLPGLSGVENRPVLLTAAVLLVAVALWVAGREERLINPPE